MARRGSSHAKEHTPYIQRMDLSRRHRTSEILDDPGLAPKRRDAALNGLRRINRLSRSAAIVWREIEPLTRGKPGQTFDLLDIASGGGDVPIAIWKRARNAGVSLNVVGCDISERAVEFARESASRAKAPVQFEVRDVLSTSWERQFDFVTTSLFLHHLSDDEAVKLLTIMAKLAKRAVIINDLRRGRWGYWLAWFGVRVLSRSDIVHFDGPVSVEAAFTVKEIRKLAMAAGQEGAVIQRRWPARLVYCRTLQ